MAVHMAWAPAVSPNFVDHATDPTVAEPLDDIAWRAGRPWRDNNMFDHMDENAPAYDLVFMAVNDELGAV